MEITAEGLVIREVLINDNDKLLTLFTADLGKITVIAKGVKGIKSKNSSAVQLFCYSVFELTGSGERYVLKTASLKESFYGLRDDLMCFALSSYVVDVVSAVTTENTEDNEIFRLALNTLFVLSRNKEQPRPVWLVKAAFELKVISLAGFMPDLTGCGACGEETGASASISPDFLDKQKKLSFYISEGTLLCNECRKSEEFAEGGAVVKLSESTLAAMRYILVAPVNKYLSFRLADEYAYELSEVCEQFLVAQLERKFETLAFYKKCLSEK